MAHYPLVLLLLVVGVSNYIVGGPRYTVESLDGAVGRAALEVADAERILNDVLSLADRGDRWGSVEGSEPLTTLGIKNRQTALGLLVRLGTRARALETKERVRASCLLGRLVHDDPETQAEYCELGKRLWPLIPALRTPEEPVTAFDNGLLLVGTSSGIVRSDGEWRQFGWFVRLRNEIDETITANIQFRWHDAAGDVIDVRNRFEIEVPAGTERVVFGEHVLSPEDAQLVAGTSVSTPTCLKLAFDKYCLGGDRFTLPLFPNHVPLLPPTPADTLEGFMWDDDAGLGVVLLNGRIIRIARSVAGEPMGDVWNTVRGRIESTYGRADRIEHGARQPGTDLHATVKRGDVPRLMWQEAGWSIELLWPEPKKIFVFYTVDDARDMLAGMGDMVGAPPA